MIRDKWLQKMNRYFDKSIDIEIKKGGMVWVNKYCICKVFAKDFNVHRSGADIVITIRGQTWTSELE